MVIQSGLYLSFDPHLSIVIIWFAKSSLTSSLFGKRIQKSHIKAIAAVLSSGECLPSLSDCLTESSIHWSRRPYSSNSALASLFLNKICMKSFTIVAYSSGEG